MGHFVLFIQCIKFRFPSDPDDQPAEVWCQQKGLVPMVKNPYVYGSIWVSDKPYLINDV